MPELATQASRDDTPIVQPLLLAFPEQPALIGAGETAPARAGSFPRPVWKPRVFSVDVLVPTGTRIDR